MPEEGCDVKKIELANIQPGSTAAAAQKIAIQLWWVQSQNVPLSSPLSGFLNDIMFENHQKCRIWILAISINFDL